jgi:hypothetical protein
MTCAAPLMVDRVLRAIDHLAQLRLDAVAGDTEVAFRRAVLAGLAPYPIGVSSGERRSSIILRHREKLHPSPSATLCCPKTERPPVIHAQSTGYRP